MVVRLGAGVGWDGVNLQEEQSRGMREGRSPPDPSELFRMLPLKVTMLKLKFKCYSDAMRRISLFCFKNEK